MSCEVNSYLTITAAEISNALGIELNESQIELSYLINEWRKSQQEKTSFDEVVRLFKAIDNNIKLRAYLLGVAPNCNMTSYGGRVLHNIITATDPSYPTISDAGCSEVYAHCATLFDAIPISCYRPSRNEILMAVAALREVSVELADALYEAESSGIIDAGKVCRWAAEHSAVARRIPELRLLLSSCALASQETTAGIVDLCSKLVCEFGHDAYTASVFSE